MAEYKDIEGFPGYYAGTDGTIWCSRPRNGKGPTTYTRRLLSPILRKRGYLTVTLYKDNKPKMRYVHHLILETFVGPRPANQEARHFPDRTRTNNNLSNLQWGTRKQNIEDAHVHGTFPHGKTNGMSKLKAADIPVIRAMASRGISNLLIGKKFGVNRGTILPILKGMTWKHVR